MSENLTVSLLPHQFDALECAYSDEFPFPTLVGGIGSGKTFTGAWWSVIMADINPISNGFIGANSYKQLEEVTLNSLFQIMDAHNIPYHYKQHKSLLWVKDKKYICRTMDNPDALRGFEASDFWCDEVRDTKEEAMKVLLGRLRDKRGNAKIRGLMTTSPVGYNWLYDWLVLNPRKGFKWIRAKTKDNHHLPDTYIPMLTASYDAKMLKQELEGEFLNILADAVYYGFSRARNVREFELFPNIPLRIGMDFNVNPMTAIVYQVVNECIYVWDEFYLKNSNTIKMANAITDKYGSGWEIIPDSTGRALKSSSGNKFDTASKSDHEILEDAGFIIPSVANPAVRDRVNCVNGLCEKARIIIHPRCVKLTTDLEQVSHGKNDPMLTHISDAFGYPCWHHFPIRKERPMQQYSY